MPEKPLNVFLTVDVEIWPQRWDLDPGNFSRYFDTYIIGKTASGGFGLPFQLGLLAEHGLKAVFFVEPLFAFEFGMQPLREIVSMIRGFGQEVQPHLHTEWVGKMTHSILPGRVGINMRQFSKDEQTFLIAKGLENLRSCGVEAPCAFRAGSFGANRDTLRAVAKNGLKIDSSYNLASQHGAFLEDELWQPGLFDGVKEFPVTVYGDILGRRKHAQINTTSYREFAHILQQAHARRWHSSVIFWHSAELLNESRSRRDPVAISRLEKLCRYLADRRTILETRWFSEMLSEDLPAFGTLGPLSPTPLDSIAKYGEQLVRKVFLS